MSVFVVRMELLPKMLDVVSSFLSKHAHSLFFLYLVLVNNTMFVRRPISQSIKYHRLQCSPLLVAESTNFSNSVTRHYPSLYIKRGNAQRTTVENVWNISAKFNFTISLILFISILRLYHFVLTLLYTIYNYTCNKTSKRRERLLLKTSE